MKLADFGPDAPGKLVQNLNGQLAFVPEPLPGPLRLDTELVSLLNEAERGLGRVAGVAGTLPNPAIVTRAFVRREAQLSSKIENFHTSYADLAVAGLTPAAPAERPDAVTEVLNNEAALTFALSAIRQDGRRLNSALVRQMHAVLMRGARGASMRPGQYRDRQVFLGAGDTIDDAAFVPPPTHAVPDLMDGLDAFWEQPSDLPPLVRNAMAHYQFETIHPFLDGNGRTGRALVLLMMCADGQLPHPTLNPSLHMERSRPEYYRRLREVSTLNKWSAWIKFFARSVAAVSDDAIRRIEAIRQLQAQYHARLRQRGRSALLLTLVDHLFVEQAVNIPLAAEHLGGVKFDTAARHVATLVESGILTEVTGRERDRVFVAEEIIRAIQS